MATHLPEEKAKEKPKTRCKSVCKCEGKTF